MKRRNIGVASVIVIMARVVGINVIGNVLAGVTRAPVTSSGNLPMASPKN